MRISDWSSDVCSSDLRVRAFLHDQLVQLARQAVDEVLLALAFLREAIVVRTAGVNDVRDRNVEVGLHVGHRGQAGGGDGDAVIALDAADDLLLLRPAQRVVSSEEHTSELQSLLRISY